MDLLLGEVREKENDKLSSGKALTHLGRLFGRAGQNLILLFPTFDPTHLETQFESNRRKFSFSISKTWGKKLST